MTAVVVVRRKIHTKAKDPEAAGTLGASRRPKPRAFLRAVPVVYFYVLSDWLTSVVVCAPVYLGALLEVCHQTRGGRWAGLAVRREPLREVRTRGSRRRLGLGGGSG